MKDYSFSKSKKRVDGKKFILIVDDDKNIRFVLKTLLEKNNYQVETTGNLSGLRRVLSDLVPDLIITDVKLPDGNFFDEISGIKKQYSNLPIIIISAFSTLSTAVKAVRHGAFEYISKPFDIIKILQVTENAFDELNENKISVITKDKVKNYSKTSKVNCAKHIIDSIYNQIRIK